MTTNAETERVICSDCGMVVRGLRTHLGRWAVRRHKRPDGQRCWGYFHVSGHRPVPSNCPVCNTNQVNPVCHFSGCILFRETHKRAAERSQP